MQKLAQQPLTDRTEEMSELEAISFFVPMAPAVKGNSSVIKVRGRGAKRRRYVGKSDKVIADQSELRLLASCHAPRVPWSKAEWAVRLDVLFVFEVPKKSSNWPAWKRLEALDGRVYPTGENWGDRDNLHKLLGDALEQAGFFESDSQIVDGIVAKRFGPTAGYWIQLTRLPQSQGRRSYGYPGQEVVVVDRSAELVRAVLPIVAVA